MKKSHLLTLLVLALVVAAENAAMAAQLLFTPRATVTERFSDNIYLTKNDKKDDFITTPTVGFTLELPGQSTGLSLSYDGGYNFYAKNDENDGWQHNALGSFWHNFTRETRLDLNNSFLYTQDPLGNRDVVNQQGTVVAPGDFTRRSGLNTYYRNYSTARLTHQFGPENSTYAQFIYGFLKNDSDQYQDSQEISPSVGMTYWWSLHGRESNSKALTCGVFTAGGRLPRTPKTARIKMILMRSPAGCGSTTGFHRITASSSNTGRYTGITTGTRPARHSRHRRSAKPGLYGVCALRRRILPI